MSYVLCVCVCVYCLSLFLFSFPKLQKNLNLKLASKILKVFFSLSLFLWQESNPYFNDDPCGFTSCYKVHKKKEKKGKNILFSSLQSNDTSVFLTIIFTCIFFHVSCIHKYIIVKTYCTFMDSFITMYNMWCLLALQFGLNHHQIQILYL
jgi:hypothetical protein